MSEFRGVFANLPGVSCDRFDGVNLNSDQFFLSHCHADHMKGLEDRMFHQTLSKNNKVKVNHRIYCSAISKTFIVKKFGGPGKTGLDHRFVRVLPHNEPVLVDVYNKAKRALFKLRVTAVPANHCPGSVMFLFETMSESDPDVPVTRILYTGDFRFENVDLTSLSALHDPSGNQLPMDEMFLDTTFASPNYETFPARTEAIRKIWEIVQDWVRKNGLYKRHRHKHVVLLHLPAQFGSEAILRHIFDQSGAKWKIHVGQKKFDEYLCTEDLGGCTSSECSEAQWIHACSWRGHEKQTLTAPPGGGCMNRLPCQKDTPFEVLQIRPSAMYFKKDRIDKVVKCVGGESYRVCYSCHSSLAELRDFVKYFHPKKIVPCVVPKGMSSVRDVLALLLPFLDNPPGQEECADGTSSPQPEAACGYSAAPLSTNDTQMDFLDNFSSPPKRKLSHATTTDESAPPAKKPLTRKITFDHSPHTSSDDEEMPEVAPRSGKHNSAKSKRSFFQKSRLAAYSMPVQPSDLVWSRSMADSFQQSRRASLPHNLKIPQITITPSSPSPDPNHPDYPEFFEDKMYLESYKRSCSNSSGESAAGNTDSCTQNPTKQENPEVDEVDQELSESAAMPPPASRTTPHKLMKQESISCQAELMTLVEDNKSTGVRPRKLVKQESISQKAELMTLKEENQAEKNESSPDLVSTTEEPKPGKSHKLVKQQSLMQREQPLDTTGDNSKSSPDDPLNQAFVDQTSDDEEVVCLSNSETGQDWSDDQSTPDLETVMSTCKNPTERNNCMKFVRCKSREESNKQ